MTNGGVLCGVFRVTRDIPRQISRRQDRNFWTIVHGSYGFKNLLIGSIIGYQWGSDYAMMARRSVETTHLV